MTATMPELMKSLTGRRVRLRLTPAGGGGTRVGRLVGTLESADGMVVFLEPEEAPGTSFSCNYQHVEAIASA